MDALYLGAEPVPLPVRFARIKRRLIAGREADVDASWGRLIAALRAEAEHIDGLGAHLVPSVEAADLDEPAQAARFGRDLRRYGVGIVRKALPRAAAEAAAAETLHCLDGRQRQAQGRPGPGGEDGRGPGSGSRGAHAPAARRACPLARTPAPHDDPTLFDCFWTPAQVLARAHPGIMRAQRFMLGLWDAGSAAVTAAAPPLRLPVAYVDRLRIHGGGYGSRCVAAPGTANDGARDWIRALEASQGIMALAENGSLERWEPDGYGRGGTYDAVFAGRWEDYDPWDSAGRRRATLDLYNGYGACSVLRLFQGLVALTMVEPGIVRVLPSPRLATAYFLLRPFFRPVRGAPGPAAGAAAWDAYLAADNWALQREPDSTIHGAVPGFPQHLTESWHPHLRLARSLVTLPTLQPGDYVLWHPDLAHRISRSGGGGHGHDLGGHGHDLGGHDHDLGGLDAGEARGVGMLAYVPAAPLTQHSALYLSCQRNAFLRGNPAPDFAAPGYGFVPEDPRCRPGEREIAAIGGADALRAMGLAPWVSGAESGAEEADLVRLANHILFPEEDEGG